MKKTILTSFLACMIFSMNISAQETNSSEKFGKTVNLGLGLGGYSGYYGYVGRTMPVLHADYEIDAAKCFTLAPFINFYSYKNVYYWGDKNHPYKNYYYSETVIPVGVKGTYYFDKLLEASSNWDFYLAGSLGFAIVNSSWDNDYYGDKDYYHNGNPLFLDLHLGAEYHISGRIGMFLDLSTGVSTIGLAIH
ncbi:MAG: hypothetical protein KKA07_10825 [Bacteroidetes bacterium]|nr:hypothetical protein [Bacteroidota bacterium]MBU1719551.1 hypothetical protein [Bacteroidota bacterium]